ncbi:hypothetical protein VNO80_09285 [Phaseolus coccineus]|uniref:Plant heme peroxidase family profile domain-containing protein n=1 Tax=Phaseolus coccineus TaxID=3886 RepID=A0AAN9N6I7_PHACN
MAKPDVDQEYLKEIEKARRELRALINTNKCVPLMLRLAWNDACTYDAERRTGGPNGSIRAKQELKHETNKGLEKAVQLCETVKAKLKKVSYADLYQLAGVVAVELIGGPYIDFVPGRMDSHEFPREGRLLNGEEGNKIRALLSKDASSRLAMDDALVKDEKFRYYIQLYAKDEDTFLKDYAISHKKLSELGCNLKKVDEAKEAYEKQNQLKGLIGISIVSVVVTVVLGYFLKRKKNQLEK